MAIQLKTVPIEYLQPGKFQPRKHFSTQKLQELADSIKAHGLIEPLIIRKLSPDAFEIIAGERRWRAAMLAKIAEVPALICTYDDEKTAAISLVENIQRENLNPIEEAQGYQRLYSQFHFHQDEISLLVGKSRSHIANLLRLLNLSSSVQALVQSEVLSLGHARVLVGLPEPIQIHLANKVKQQHWSVRRLENEVRHHKSPKKIKSTKNKCADSQSLENQLAELLGTPVEIDTNPTQGGWLKIKFYDNDTLSGLLEKMGLGYD